MGLMLVIRVLQLMKYPIFLALSFEVLGHVFLGILLEFWIVLIVVKVRIC